MFISLANQHSVFFSQAEWVHFRNNHYYISRGEMNQNQARAYCHDQGAELASINSWEEHVFLISQTGG